MSFVCRTTRTVINNNINDGLYWKQTTSRWKSDNFKLPKKLDFAVNRHIGFVTRGHRAEIFYIRAVYFRVMAYFYGFSFARRRSSKRDHTNGPAKTTVSTSGGSVPATLWHVLFAGFLTAVRSATPRTHVRRRFPLDVSVSKFHGDRVRATTRPR